MFSNSTKFIITKYFSKGFITIVGVKLQELDPVLES